MKHFKILKVFLILFFMVFITLPNISAQDSYNIFTLEYFKQSVESLIHGDYDNAILQSSHVIRRDPDSSLAYTIRARAYYEKGDMTNAITDSSRALSLDRGNVSAYSIRANAYVKNGDLNRAITDWRSILRINPESADAQRNIDIALEQLEAR
jgi:Tfp pilus assembly protein PilF